MSKKPVGTAPVVYEVRLEVDPGIRRDFDRWLDGHVRAMIALPGFYDARIIRADPGPDGRVRRLVRYRLRDRAALDDYLKRHAEAMRRDGLHRFGERFSAERDVYPAKTDHEEDGEHRCPNCGAVANRAFCPSCGQEQKDIHVSFGRLVLDFLGDAFNFDSRLTRSLRPLVARPGFLTREYFLGRRARYIPPLRLYLFISIVFFGLLSLMLSGADFVRMDAEGGSPAEQEQAAETEEQADRDEPNINVNLFGHSLSPEIENRLERQARKVNESPALFARYLLGNLPVMMFLLLPVYSLILRLLYPFAGFVYLEHLIFSLHVHAFTFLVLLFLMTTDFVAGRLAPTATLWPFYTAISLYWVAYPWMAMRTAYGQGVAMTTLKYVLQSVIYVVLLAASITAVSLGALYWF